MNRLQSYIPQEVDEFFQILNKMAGEGHALIFISHKLQEVIKISHRVTILRDGRSVGHRENINLTKTGLAEMMVGRPVVLQYDREPPKLGKVKLRVENLWVKNDWAKDQLRGVPLKSGVEKFWDGRRIRKRAGGIWLMALAGLRSPSKGRIEIEGVDMTKASPYDRNLAGQSYIPEERNKEGVILEFRYFREFYLRGS